MGPTLAPLHCYAEQRWTHPISQFVSTVTYQYLVANAPSPAPAAEAILSLRIPAQRVSKPTCACDWEARRTRDAHPYNFRLPLRMLYNVECPLASLAHYTVLGLELSSCEMRIYDVKCHMHTTWDDLR